MDKREFQRFFKPYSRNVDNADRQAFWRLSDAIIMEIIKRHIPLNSSKDKIIMDAGGGTGRWVCELSKLYKSKFILYDLSEDMLIRARKNITDSHLEKRVKIIKGNLVNIREIKENSIDYIISIYSPISFIYRKNKALSEMFRILKSGGKILIMGQGYYNAIFSKINNYNASPREIKEIERKFMVKWTPFVPKLHVFSKESLESNLEKVKFKVLKTYGIPIFVQPGAEDFDPRNIKQSKISIALKDRKFFQEVLHLEMKYNNNPYLVNRGVNIISVAVKP